jgi:glycosylphosphatidylinositol transamidase (GPIT) subunit GPI8
VYINTLGGEGILTFPNFEYLYADQLRDIFVEMKDRKLYNKMLIYLESSFSGSIFEGDLLPKNLSILAVTATESNENSFASNCYPLDRVLGKNKKVVSLGTCLAD